jgi:hypothetical protein
MTLSTTATPANSWTSSRTNGVDSGFGFVLSVYAWAAQEIEARQIMSVTAHLEMVVTVQASLRHAITNGEKNGLYPGKRAGRL